MNHRNIAQHFGALASLATVAGLVLSCAAVAGVSVSKGNAYVVIEPPVAVWVSKGNAYAVIDPPPAVWVSKANAYAVIEPPLSVWASKAVAYAVIASPPQPSVFIMTKNENSCRPEAGFLLVSDSRWE